MPQPGIIWTTLKRRPADFDKAIELESDNAEVVGERGAFLSYHGKYDEALECFNTAIMLDPDNPTVYSDMAFQLATCNLAKYRNGKKGS